MTAHRYDRDVLRQYLSHSLDVLALWEPWAVLCVAPDPTNDGRPPKEHETRHWYPRGRAFPFAVAIHAAKKFDKTVKATLDDMRFRNALLRTGYYPSDPRPFLERKMAPPAGKKPIPLGAIVGLAQVTGISSAQAVPMQAQLDGVSSLELDSLTADDRAFGYFERSDVDTTHHIYRYAWRLENAVLLPTPIPHFGRQEALYPVDAETREEINSQLGWLEMAA
jgi:hypothetical protein